MSIRENNTLRIMPRDLMPSDKNQSMVNFLIKLLQNAEKCWEIAANFLLRINAHFVNLDSWLVE